MFVLWRKIYMNLHRSINLPVFLLPGNLVVQDWGSTCNFTYWLTKSKQQILVIQILLHWLYSLGRMRIWVRAHFFRWALEVGGGHWKIEAVFTCFMLNMKENLFLTPSGHRQTHWLQWFHSPRTGQLAFSRGTRCFKGQMWNTLIKQNTLHKKTCKLSYPSNLLQEGAFWQQIKDISQYLSLLTFDFEAKENVCFILCLEFLLLSKNLTAESILDSVHSL